MKSLLFLVLLLHNIGVFSASVTVGVLKYAPPFSALAGDGNHFFGFAIDMMDNICKRMNQKCTYKATTLSEQLTLLNDGSVDLIFAPNPIINPVPQQYLFSLPYLASNAQFLTLKDNNINNLAEVTDKKIGVVKFTLFNSLLRSRFGGIDTVIEFDTVSALIAALVSKNVDVILLNASVAKYVTNNDVTELKLVGDKIPMGDGYGILALETNGPLIKEVNKALLSMEADGTYLKIYNQYFGD